MQVVEFGKEHTAVVMLLHGGGLSWWNYQEVAAVLQKQYHVVIPLLDGHAGSDSDFVSIEDSAQRLCQYIQQEFGGSVYAIGGLSLGAQILVEMLCQAPNICQKAMIESACVIPVPTTHKLVKPMVKMSYGLMQKHWFAKLQSAQLHIASSLFNAYYTDTCKISMDNMISFMQSNSSYVPKSTLPNTTAEVTIVVGSKEPKVMRSSAKRLHEMLPHSNYVVLSGYYHGQLSLSHAKEYIQLLLGE